MRFKLTALMFCLLITACQNAYEPDHTLKKAWSHELEQSQPSQIPYGVVYEIGSKKVIYVAVNSEQIKANTLIESLVETWKPQVILCQGHTKEILSPSEVRFKHKDMRSILKGASAGRAQILEHLSRYGVNERDYEIYSVINLMNQMWQYETKSPEELRGKVVHYLKTDPNAKGFHLTYGEIQNWFVEKTGYPMTMEAVLKGTPTAPMNPRLKTTSYLQKIAFYQDEIDDAFAMESLAKALEEYDTVMIIRASSKYVMEREVLHNMFGVSQPVKIIN